MTEESREPIYEFRKPVYLPPEIANLIPGWLREMSDDKDTGDLYESASKRIKLLTGYVLHALDGGQGEAPIPAIEEPLHEAIALVDVLGSMTADSADCEPDSIGIVAHMAGEKLEEIENIIEAKPDLPDNCVSIFREDGSGGEV